MTSSTQTVKQLKTYHRAYRRHRRILEASSSSLDPRQGQLESIDRLIRLIHRRLVPKDEQAPFETKQPEFSPPTEADEPTLRKGDKSLDGWVEYMQKLVNHHLGSGTVPEAGNFDQQTYKAVRRFQRAKKCQVDGIVGNQTWSALREAPREEVGTDGREPHAFVEHGAEARWATESNDFVEYDEPTDELKMTLFSVGDKAADSFQATLRITGANGVSNVTKHVLGAPTKHSSTSAGHAHTVRVPQIKATYGVGIHNVEAYLDAELGGDNWSGTVTIAGGGGGQLPEAVGSVVYSIIDAKKGNSVKATVTVDGNTIDGESDGVFVDVIPAGERLYKVSAPGYQSDSGTVSVPAGGEVELVVPLTRKRGGKGRGLGSVSYSITDAVTGESVIATVTVAGRSIDGESDGIFVEVIPSGKRSYQVTAPGYHPESGRIQVKAGKEVELSVELSRKASPPVAPTGTLAFQVTDSETGESVPEATVEAAGKSKETDSSGIALFEDLEAITHPYRVTHPFYEDGSGNAIVHQDARTPVEVQLNYLPESQAKFEFQVKDVETNDPIAGATVTFGSQTKTANSSGAAVFDLAMESGTHEYQATARGYDDVRDGLEVNSGSDGYVVSVLMMPSTTEETSTTTCYKPRKVPQFQAAPDGEELPTKQHLIPFEVLNASSEVCVTTRVVRPGKLYRVKTEAKINRSRANKVFRELGIDLTLIEAFFEGSITALELAKKIPKKLAFVVSIAEAMLDSKESITAEHHGDATSLTGKPVTYTVLYSPD